MRNKRKLSTSNLLIALSIIFIYSSANAQTPEEKKKSKADLTYTLGISQVNGGGKRKITTTGNSRQMDVDLSLRTFNIGFFSGDKKSYSSVLLGLGSGKVKSTDNLYSDEIFHFVADVNFSPPLFQSTKLSPSFGIGLGMWGSSHVAQSELTSTDMEFTLSAGLSSILADSLALSATYRWIYAFSATESPPSYDPNYLEYISVWDKFHSFHLGLNFLF